MTGSSCRSATGRSTRPTRPTGAAPFYHPGEDSDELEYLRDRRRELGGPVPERRVDPRPLKLPGDEVYAELKQGSGKQSIATTMAFVRLLKDLMKDPEIGHRIVPIAPDEFRTFGMDSMFSTRQDLQPGRPELRVGRPQAAAGLEGVGRRASCSTRASPRPASMASATAAGSAYATHGEPMIPFYIFYSMFGFQRTGDSIWAMTDQLARGFLIGATAGRTTLTGEGLQHADGHSPLLAATNPAVVHYDPAFAYEVTHIVQDGLRRMYGSSEEQPARRGRHLLPDRLQRADRAAGRARRPRRRGAAQGHLPRGRAARGAADGRSAGAAAGRGRRLPVDPEGRSSCWPRSGASRPTSGRSPRGTSWPATALAAEEWNLLHPDEPGRTAVRHREAAADARARSSRSRDYMSRRTPADRPVGARRLPRARHRRLRLRRHPPGRPALLPRRRRVGRRPGPPGPRRRRRGPAARRWPEAFDAVPHRRPDRRTRAY